MSGTKLNTSHTENDISHFCPHYYFDCRYLYCCSFQRYNFRDCDNTEENEIFYLLHTAIAMLDGPLILSSSCATISNFKTS